MEEQSYYLVKKIDNDITHNGVSIPAGYYRVNYKISGRPVEHACQYSKDRAHWEDTILYKSFSEFRDLFDDIEDGMLFEKMEYIETIKYKNHLVPVFIDDYGQCFYAIYKNQEIVFGSYNGNYEEEIKYLIDRDEGIAK